MKSSLLAFFLVCAAAAPRVQAAELVVTVGGNEAREMVSALLTSGLTEHQTAIPTVYDYTVENLACKWSNHGGPEDYGIGYLVGCYQNVNLQGDWVGEFGSSGEKFAEASHLVDLIEKTALAHEGEGAMFFDCGMGKCYGALRKLECSIDTTLETAAGCNCRLTFSDLY